MSGAGAAGISDKRLQRARRVVMLILLLTVLVFVAANAHLLYVAMDSAPPCLDHVKVGQQADGFSAAQSAC